MQSTRTFTHSRVLVYCTDKSLPAHCVIYRINDLDSRLEVIQGRWFWHQSKARIWLPIGPQ